MNTYKNSQIGIELPLQGLEIYKEEDRWLVLKNPGQEAYLSIQFSFHFFMLLEEVEDYIQKEMQLLADSNDLVQFNSMNRHGDDTVTANFFQFIDNISHLVYMGIKLLPDHKGYYYMAVTKDETMTDYCESLFLKTKYISSKKSEQTDKSTKNKLSNHTLKYMSSYNSNWGSGGGTSTEKFYTLYADHSFKYEYRSVISFGSMGGNTSQDNGWGFWEVLKNKEGIFLVLRWHMKGMTVYQLEWGEPGILFLDNEKWLLD